MAHGIKNWNISLLFVKTSLVPDNRFFVENPLEELDQPGEWCLDSEAGILYFWPPVSPAFRSLLPRIFGKARLLAANELGDYIEKMTGVRIPVDCYRSSDPSFVHRYAILRT